MTGVPVVVVGVTPHQGHFHPWELGFKQSGLRHITRTLRGSAINAFTTLHVFPPCCCPLALSRPGKAGSPEASPSEPLLSERAIQRRVRRPNFAMTRLSRARTTTGPPPHPAALGRRRACPGPGRLPGLEGDRGWFPRSLDDRSTREVPSSCPGSIATTTPQSFIVASSPTALRGFGVDCNGGHALHPSPYPPDWSRFVAYGALPLVPRVHLLVSLAGPAQSGSASTSRRCQGRFPPSPTSPGSGCPQLQPDCCDSPVAGSFHPRPVIKRLVAHGAVHDEHGVLANRLRGHRASAGPRWSIIRSAADFEMLKAWVSIFTFPAFAGCCPRS